MWCMKNIIYHISLFMHFFVIYIYTCGVKCRVVFKVGRPEFPFDAQSDLWVGPTNINLLIANRISPIYTQIFTYFQRYFLIFIITFAQSDLLVANINFPLFTQTYFLKYFLLCYISFSPMSKCKMQKSVPLTLRWIAGWTLFLHLWLAVLP